MPRDLLAACWSVPRTACLHGGCPIHRGWREQEGGAQAEEREQHDEHPHESTSDEIRFRQTAFFASIASGDRDLRNYKFKREGERTLIGSLTLK